MGTENENSNKLVLRDYLALDRTALANERTLLSYLRTGIMLLISGITIIKLFEENPYMVGFGTLLIPLSLFVAIRGYIRFHSVRKRIHWPNELPYSEFIDRSG